MKKNPLVVALVCVLALAFALCGCTNEQKTDGVDHENQKTEGVGYADNEAMEVIASGLEARWGFYSPEISDDPDATLKASVKAELDIDKALKDRPFENKKMQEDVLAYINCLEDLYNVLDNPSTESSFYDAIDWDSLKLTALLKTFVDDYGLTVDKDYSVVLEDLMVDGAKAQERIKAAEAQS